MAAIAVLILSYLLGAVPFGLLLGRWRGVDPRKVGSGNIGATNVIRAGGRGLGVATFILDMGKGAACPLVARGVGLEPEWVAAAGLVAILGHCFPVYLRFRGGKGVATAAGAVLALAPAALGISTILWIVVLAATGYVSLASMLGAIAFPLAVRFTNPGDHYSFGVGVALAAFILVTHRSNIHRLVAGQENRFGNRERAG